MGRRRRRATPAADGSPEKWVVGPHLHLPVPPWTVAAGLLDKPGGLFHFGRLGWLGGRGKWFPLLLDRAR